MRWHQARLDAINRGHFLTEEKIKSFGTETAMKRAGQPSERRRRPMSSWLRMMLLL